MFIPRTHEGSVTSCFPAVERNTHTHIHTHALKRTTQRLSGSKAHTDTHTACSCLQSAEKSPGFFSVSSPPYAPVPVFPPHTFRSTSLVPLEQVMTTQGGSAAMATPSATSSCPPQPSILWWGPGRNSSFIHKAPSLKELMELDIVSGLLSSHLPLRWQRASKSRLLCSCKLSGRSTSSIIS